MKDKNGNSLSVDDIIVYCTRDSCFSYLRVGLVTRVWPNRVRVQQIEKSGVHKRGANLVYPDRILLVSESHLSSAESKALGVYYANQNR